MGYFHVIQKYRIFINLTAIFSGGGTNTETFRL